MQFFDALDQLNDIRRLMMRASTFRGFRSSTTFATAMIAVITGVLHWQLANVGNIPPREFVLIWTTSAFVCALAMLGGALVRLYRFRSSIENELALSVLETLMPSLAIGALVTLAAVWQRRDLIPLLPAWWMILMSVGVFALRTQIGRAVILPAGFYGVCGLASLVVANPTSPFWMAGVFACGQTLAALALRLTLERHQGERRHGA